MSIQNIGKLSLSLDADSLAGELIRQLPIGAVITIRGGNKTYKFRIDQITLTASGEWVTVSFE